MSPATEVPAAANGYASHGLHAAADDDLDQLDDLPRRRWPIVTTVLVVLVLLVAGGLFGGWRYIEGQYYVNADGGQVSIYRGVNQPIAWMHFSSVYKRTKVTSAMVPATLELPTNSGSLSQAQQTVTTIQQTAQATCQRATSQLTTYNAAWTTYRKNLASWGKATAKARKGKKPPVKPTLPKPAAAPAYCPALGAG
jgi:PPM family protein phosphatase